MFAIAGRILAIPASLLVLLAAQAGRAQDLFTAVPGLDVSLAFSDLEGRRSETLEPGKAYRLSISYRDPSSSEAATKVQPMGWFRKSRAGMPVCTEAVRAFRATSRLSGDDIPLVGTVIGARDRAGRIAFAEPDVHLANANLLALKDIQSPGGVMTPRPDLGDMLAGRPEFGDVVSLAAPLFAPRVVASGLGQVSSLILAASGRFWAVAEKDGKAILKGPDGNTIALHDVQGAKVQAHAAGARKLLLQDMSRGAVRVIDRDTGRLLRTIGPLPVISTATSEAAFAVENGNIKVFYLEGDHTGETWSPGFSVTGLTTDPTGQRALVWGGDGELAILDVARGGSTRARYRAEGQVSQAIMSNDAAFIGWRNRSVVTVIMTSQLAQGDAALRDVRLDNGATAVEELVALDPVSGVLARLAGGRALHTVLAGGGLAQSPGSVLTLRSDAPVALAVLRRAPVEVSPGVFETSFTLPRGGAWELVTTTGLRGTTRCFPLNAGSEDVSQSDLELQVAVEGDLQAGQPATLIIDAPGVQEARLELVMSLLNTGWTKPFFAVRESDKRFRARVVFPRPGLYPIIAPAHAALAASSIEVSR